MKHVKIERRKGYYGSLRTLELYVDGTCLGHIRQGEEKVFEVHESGREIWGKMDWGKTVKLSLNDYAQGKAVVFESYFTFDLFKNLGISKLPFRVFIQ